MIQKTPSEIELMRKAGELTCKALMYAKTLIKPGVSTYDLDKAIEKFIIESGGSPACLGYQGFPAATCISVNEMVKFTSVLSILEPVFQPYDDATFDHIFITTGSSLHKKLYEIVLL